MKKELKHVLRLSPNNDGWHLSGTPEPIISDPGDEVESISCSNDFPVIRPRYSKAFLSQMNESAEAVSELFKKFCQSGPGNIMIDSKFRTLKEQQSIEMKFKNPNKNHF